MKSLTEHTLADPTWNALHSTVIYPLDNRHVDAVYKIAGTVFPKPWEKKDFSYFLSHPTNHSFGVFHRTFDNKKGELQSFFISFLAQGDLDIVSIATDPRHLRKGHAEQLGRYACTRPEVQRAFLEVDVENTPAIRLYVKIGFDIISRRRKYYNNERDAFVMRWVHRNYQSDIN